MDRNDLKKLIIDSINANPNIREKVRVLKNNKLGDILQCYKESVDEYRPERTEFDKYVREKFLLNDIVFKPEKTKATLKFWAKTEIWHSIVGKTGKCPDEYDFNIKFHQVLDEFKSD